MNELSGLSEQTQTRIGGVNLDETRRDSRSSSSALRSFDIFQQQLVIVRDNNPNTESASHEEEHEAPDERGVRPPHQFPRVFCFRGCHGDELRPNHARIKGSDIATKQELSLRERALDHTRQDPKKTASRSWSKVLDERPLSRQRQLAVNNHRR